MVLNETGNVVIRGVNNDDISLLLHVQPFTLKATTILPPSMWLGGGLNPEQWFKLKVKTGQVFEGSVRDEGGSPQGTILVRVTQPVLLDSSGHLFQAEYLTASDPHYRWWMTHGDGRGLKKNASYHSCGVRAHECPYKKGKTKIIHLERIRLIGAKEWKAKTPAWCFKAPCKKEIQEFHDAMAKSNVEEPGGVTLPWAESDPGEESSEEETEAEDAGTAQKIARLKAELERLERRGKAEPAKKKKKRKGGQGPPREEDRKDKVKKKKKGKKPGRRRKAESEEEVITKKKKRKQEGALSEEEEASSSEEDLFIAKKSKKEDLAIYPKKGDRGPFGAGVPMEFDDDDTTDSDQEAVFRDAPAQPQKSGQLALMTYSHQKPGRLAARLLMKMRNEVTLGSAGAEGSSREKTPATGVQYLLTILLPQLGQRANLRTQRELRTLMVAVDLLARKNPARAADVLCQRVKALERASMDGGWSSAQFLELIPAENSSLLERDEEVYLSKEALLEQKLRRKDQGGLWKGGGVRADRKGEKGRGKGSKNQEDTAKGRGKTDSKDK